jgi:hypothetical protein
MLSGARRNASPRQTGQATTNERRHRIAVTMSGWRLSRGVSCVNFWILAGLGVLGGGRVAVQVGLKFGQVFGQADYGRTPATMSLDGDVFAGWFAFPLQLAAPSFSFVLLLRRFLTVISMS